VGVIDAERHELDGERAGKRLATVSDLTAASALKVCLLFRQPSFKTDRRLSANIGCSAGWNGTAWNRTFPEPASGSEFATASRLRATRRSSSEMP
jgi:hypothetical protein